MDIGIGDFEKAVDNVIKKRQEWEIAKAKLKLAITAVSFKENIGANPGDVLAGIAARTLLKAVSPSVVRQLDIIGIGPGKYSR